MKKIFKKYLICFMAISQIVFLLPKDIFAQEITGGNEFEENAFKWVPPSNENADFGNSYATPLDENLSDGPFDYLPEASEPNTNSLLTPSQTASSQFPSDKIILNPVDQRKLQQMETLANALPDFYDDTNLYELSSLSGTSYDQLVSLKTSDPGKFSQLVTAADEKTHNDDYLMQKVKKDPVILANLFNTTTDEMVYELQNDPQGVEAAIQRVFDTQIDKRVIKTLIYLVTPKDQGGAGHWRIKVERISKNYDKEPSKFEREDTAIKETNTLADNQSLSNTTIEQLKADQKTTASEEEQKLGDQSTAVVDIVNKQNKSTATAYIGNQTDEDNNTISSHFSGQAVDISEVDDIKCTVVGHKRIGNDKTEAQAPRPIKLSWQTQEGYAKDKAQIDSSYNSMFLNASQDSILQMLSGLNFDFASVGDMKGADFSDMAGVLAQAFLMNAINAPNGNIWKFNLSDTLRSLGGVILADELDLNRLPFLDPNVTSIDALSEAIGRSYIEENLNLPYGALKGANRDELLSSIGKQRILSELKLPDDILNNEIKDSADLYQRIGSRLVESEFGFPTGSFYGKANYGDLSKAAGKYKLDALRSVSSGADENLGLPTDTFARLESGEISPADFNRLVAEAHFTAFVQLYGNSSDTVSNLRDEAFNLPKGKIDRFLNGELNTNDYREIGIYSVSNTLETNDVGRTRIANWFNNPTENMTVTTAADDPSIPNQQITLPSLDYAGTMGVQNQDFYSIFGSADQSSGVFKRLGQQILTDAVKNSDFVTRETQDLLHQNPQVEEILGKFDFYKTRIDNIQKHSAALKTHSDKLNTQVGAIQSGVISDTIKNQITQALAKLITVSSHTEGVNSLSSFVAIGKETSDSSGQAASILTQLSQIVAGNSDKSVQDLTYEMNATTFETETIAKNAYEIITGKEQPYFKFGDLKIGDLQSPDLSFGTTTFGSSDIAMLLAGKIAPREFLLSLGSAKLAGELNLPKWSLKYIASVVDSLVGSDNADIKDAFFRALGISVMEDQASLNSGSLASSDKLGKPISIEDLRGLVKDRQGGSQLTADAIIAESLNLKGYNLSSLMRGDFAAWSLARKNAEEFDQKNGLPTGTTEKFIKGESMLGQVDKSDISEDELRNIATMMKVSEANLKTFISIREGNENPAINQVYYVDQNQYSSSQTADTPDACNQQEIPAGSYVYYDQDGLHIFNSAALANEFRKAHTDRQLNYLDEIANSISWAVYRVKSAGGVDLTGVLGDIKGNLDKFLKSSDAKAFGDDNFSKLASLMENNFDVSPAIFTKVFARSTESGTIDKSAQMDYLKVLGYHTLKYAAADFLNDYLGISFGSSKITPDDLFEIMSGNGMETFARIGGALLDGEMNLDKGTVESIFSAKSDAERKCALESAALNMIGNALGSRGMKLAGSLINAFGGGKIESALGFPKGSFKGGSLDELINNVQPENFVKAFDIPITTDVNAKLDAILQKIGADYYNSNKNDPFYTKLTVVSSYVYALGPDGPAINKELLDSFTALKNDLKTQTLAYLADPNNIDSLKSNALSIDSRLGIAAGTTLSLLQGSLKPDDYRSEVNNATLTDGLGDFLISMLGLEDTGLTVASVQGFVNAVKDIGGSDIMSSGSSGDRFTIYNFLNDLFSINLDKKAGFTEGTFALIVAHPDQASGLLIQQGIRKIDATLNIQDQPYSLENIYAVMTTASVADSSACDNPLNQTVTSFTECINNRRIASVTDSARGYLANEASNQIAAWISDITGVEVTIDGPMHESIPNAFGITMQVSDITGIARGDYRPLLLIGMVKGAGAIIGDANGRLAVSGQFLLNYQDYYTALYGDPVLEDYARMRAYASTFANFNGTNSPPPSDPDQPGVPNIAAQPNAPSGVMNTPIPGSVADETRIDVDNNYPIGPGANTAMPAAPRAIPNASDYPGNYSTYLNDLMTWTKEYSQWQSAVYTAYNTGEEAARSVRSIYKQNLQYKTMDCALYKLDGNIPAGFSQMMMNGNTYVKTTAMLNYLENFIRNETGLSSVLLPGTLETLQNFFTSPDINIHGNPDILVGLALDPIDSYLTQHSPSIMGLSIQPGTAGALFAYVKTGNINTGYAGFKSLADVYGGPSVISVISGWSDKMLKLPAGTTYQVYTAWKTIKAAQDALRVAELSQNADAIADAKTNLQDGISAAISFAINLVFSKQVGQMETALGLVPGTGAMLVSMLVSLIITGAVNPISLAIFVAINLFGVYKQEVICSADGSYPRMESPPDPTKWDVAGLGEFNALNEKARDNGFIAAAQYKAGELVFDMLSMSDRTGDPEQIPVQIMTGRVEDVGPNVQLVKNTVCNKVGSSDVQENTAICSGWRSRSGLWANPQTTSWTHVGF